MSNFVYHPCASFNILQRSGFTKEIFNHAVLLIFATKKGKDPSRPLFCRRILQFKADQPAQLLLRHRVPIYTQQFHDNTAKPLEEPGGGSNFPVRGTTKTQRSLSKKLSRVETENAIQHTSHIPVSQPSPDDIDSSGYGWANRLASTGRKRHLDQQPPLLPWHKFCP